MVNERSRNQGCDRYYRVRIGTLDRLLGTPWRGTYRTFVASARPHLNTDQLHRINFKHSRFDHNRLTLQSFQVIQRFVLLFTFVWMCEIIQIIFDPSEICLNSYFYFFILLFPLILLSKIKLSSYALYFYFFILLLASSLQKLTGLKS